MRTAPKVVALGPPGLTTNTYTHRSTVTSAPAASTTLFYFLRQCSQYYSSRSKAPQIVVNNATRAKAVAVAKNLTYAWTATVQIQVSNASGSYFAGVKYHSSDHQIAPTAFPYEYITEKVDPSFSKEIWKRKLLMCILLLGRCFSFARNTCARSSWSS